MLCIRVKQSPTLLINWKLPKFFQVSRLFEKMFSAALSNETKLLLTASNTKSCKVSFGISSSSSTGTLRSQAQIESQCCCCTTISSMPLAKSSMVPITIRADSRRSLARSLSSSAILAPMVSTKEMVVPMMIIPICFQKPACFFNSMLCGNSIFISF